MPLHPMEEETIERLQDVGFDFTPYVSPGSGDNGVEFDDEEEED